MVRHALARTAAVSILLAIAQASRAAPPHKAEFTRMVAHWANYGDPDYLDFIRDAQPEVAQLGFYGATFYGLAHTPQYKGYPAHFPVQGISEARVWFAEKNRALHKENVKVVGHFNVEFLFGDLDSAEGPRGFFKFYRDLWDEDKLGPKPVADPADFLERDAEGKPIGRAQYKIGGMGEYWACLRNPYWQRVLKAWVRRAIEQGVDGLVANYFYRHNCLCEHCQRDFRKFLSARHAPEVLRSEFGIEDLQTHRFKEIVSWHKPDESTPLRREMLSFSQVSNKQVFDEVFVRFGRSLKPDLMVAQWNHLGNFSQISGDERCLLPAELWSKGESYLWYSTGGSAFYTDLENRFLGEGTLQARYIRGASGDKPFTLGKYESTRIRTAIAELAANGGAPMGFYTRFTDPAARKEIVRYYQFMRRYDHLYHANRSHAEAVLLYPRKSVHRGELTPIEQFRQLGTSLLDDHVLLDVLPDDIAGEDLLADYRHVFKTGPKSSQSTNPNIPPEARSRFEAPFTVRVSASRPAEGEELTLHFVNYNRTEPPKSKNGRPSAGGGIVDEKPIAVSGVRADLLLPDGFRAGRVEFLTPEEPEPVELKSTAAKGRVQFTLPEFLVYGVVRVHLEKSSGTP